MTILPRSVLCQKCPTRIVWVRTEHDKMMPIDAVPNPLGNIGLDFVTDPDKPPLAVHLNEEKKQMRVEAAEKLGIAPLIFISHFATCPAAKQFRKKGRR